MLRVPAQTSSGLWPQFAAAVGVLTQWADHLGYRGQVVSGFRSMEEQERLYAIGRTPLEIRRRTSKRGSSGAVTDAPPGSSAHNYGLAIDIEGPDQGKIIALAKEMGFGIVSWDPAHVEWPNWKGLL